MHEMNNDTLPTFDADDAPINTVLSDNRTEFYSRPVSGHCECLSGL